MNKLFEKNKSHIKRTNTLFDFMRKMKNWLNWVLYKVLHFFNVSWNRFQIDIYIYNFTLVARQTNIIVKAVRNCLVALDINYKISSELKNVKKTESKQNDTCYFPCNLHDYNKKLYFIEQKIEFRLKKPFMKNDHLVYYYEKPLNHKLYLKYLSQKLIFNFKDIFF